MILIPPLSRGSLEPCDSFPAEPSEPPLLTRDEARQEASDYFQVTRVPDQVVVTDAGEHHPLSRRRACTS